jgi:hypothetical protein
MRQPIDYIDKLRQPSEEKSSIDIKALLEAHKRFPNIAIAYLDAEATLRPENVSMFAKIVKQRAPTGKKVVYVDTDGGVK